MTFKITVQYPGNREQPEKQYDQLNEAKTYVENKLLENASHKINVVYRIYEWDELVQTYDPAKMGAIASSKSSDASDQQSPGGQGKGAAFRPSPLQTRPRPKGTPPPSFKEDEEDKGK